MNVTSNKKLEVVIQSEVAGYEDYKAKEFTLLGGQEAVINSDMPMKWGKTGRVYVWMYDHIFSPCNKTMFALLAFFIASAAFRAFRARNTEALLLLGSAIVVMLGCVSIRRMFSDFLPDFLPSFPEMKDWILDFPNNAGRRAIMIGAALGAIVTGLRVGV